jgi:hypothetical protein
MMMHGLANPKSELDTSSVAMATLDVYSSQRIGNNITFGSDRPVTVHRSYS